jgi:hypothetical protein
VPAADYCDKGLLAINLAAAVLGHYLRPRMVEL